MAKEATGKKPMTFITDGLPAYHDAYKKEFFTLKGPRTEHVRHITLRGDHNNNKMERMNGEVRDRRFSSSSCVIMVLTTNYYGTTTT
jgi:hypothetical protein